MSGKFFIYHYMRYLALILCAISVAFIVPAKGQVSVQPFYVSKVSPSAGNYSTKEFALLWSAFCEQYRLGPKETFIQYPYAKSVIKSAVGAGGYYSFRHLFRDVKAGNTGGHLVGVQSSYSGTRSILTEADAKEAVIQFDTKVVTLRIGNQSTIARPGAYECVLVRQSSSQVEQDRDMRDGPVASSYRTDYQYRGTSYIYFADPASPKQGEVEIRVSREMAELNGQTALSYFEVSKLQDTKQNQDNFIEALKAGSCFRVYVFKLSSCYNCGGLGRIAPKAAAGSQRGTGGGLIGSGSIDEKCKLCAGSGRLPLGKVHALVWDRYVPSDEDLKSVSSER
jgi:hypothetical protein